MVERRIYKDEIDFATLALQSSSFNKFLKPNGQLDFSDPKAVQELTKSLLKRDFRLQIELPDDRLCPPVPNRLNYIHWIQDLIDTTSDSYSDKYEPEREVIGLDIGTGASCIYPLLGCSQRPSWNFAATDIDEKNLSCAKRNILNNDLKSRIRPLLTTPRDPLIPLDSLGLDHITFAMCNPPFYSDESDLLASAKSKSRPPNSACTGAPVEMVTPGGETAFVTRIIAESVLLKDRCQWFTSMLGKHSSVEVVVEELKRVGVNNWAVRDLVQGKKTRRWCVGWSWWGRRPDLETARGGAGPSLGKGVLPFPSEYVFAVVEEISACANRLQTIFSNLALQYEYRPTIFTGVGFAHENVWSRAARRKVKNGDLPDAGDVGVEEAALGFKIRLSTNSERATQVNVRWLQGHDTVLFESFCGMMKREMSSSL